MNKRERTEQAKKTFLEFVKPGDVVNISNHPTIFQLPSFIGCWAIRKAQKSLFRFPEQYYHNDNYEIAFNPNEDTHSMVFFNECATFSVEPPKACWLDVEDYVMDDISVYRYNEKILKDKDLTCMYGVAKEMIGGEYDIGQLIDIAVNQILGYAGHNEVTIFDAGKNRHVCSAGVAIIYQAWRKKLEIEQPRLFSKLNEMFPFWTPEFINEFKTEYKSDWFVEYTYPAMFGLTHSHFNYEMSLILKMKSGEIQYLS